MDLRDILTEAEWEEYEVYRSEIAIQESDFLDEDDVDFLGLNIVDSDRNLYRGGR